MEEGHKKARQRIQKIFGSKELKISFIESLLGAGHILCNFIKDNVETDKLTVDAAYALQMFITNLMAVISGKGKGENYKFVDLSNEKDVRKKLALTVKDIYEYCKKEGLIDGV